MNGYRKRQRATIVVAPVPVDERIVEQLIADDHLSPEESENRQSVGQSIVKVLVRMLGAGVGDSVHLALNVRYCRGFFLFTSNRCYEAEGLGLKLLRLFQH